MKNNLIHFLLLPIMPFLGWGPITHPYINRLALDKARELDEGGFLGPESDDINEMTIGKLLLRTIDRLKERIAQREKYPESSPEDTYILAGNTTDTVATHHIIHGISIYDYSHNLIPDHAAGRAAFGYGLIHEYFLGNQMHEQYHDRDFLIACGWLSHQLADYQVHYLPVTRDGRVIEFSNPDDSIFAMDFENVFPGLANSHMITGSDFYPEVNKPLRLINHAIVEFIYDAILSRTREYRKKLPEDIHVVMFSSIGEASNLLTQTSQKHFPMFNRIPPEHLNPLREDFDIIIRGYNAIIDIFHSQNKDLFRDLLARFPLTTRESRSSEDSTWDRDIYVNPDFISRSVTKIVNELFKLKLGDIENHLSHFTQDVKRKTLRRIKAKRLSTVAGSAILVFAKRFGYMLGAGDGVRPALRRTAMDWALRGVDFTQLDRYFAARIENYAHHNPNLNKSLTNFFTQLIFGDHSRLSEVVKAFRPTLQPMITIEKHPETRVPPTTPFEEMDITEKLETIYRSCVRKKGKPEHLVIKLTPALADTFSRDLMVKKGLDLDTLIFRVNGYDVLPYSLLLGAWFNNRQVESAIRNLAQPQRFSHWGSTIEAVTRKALDLLDGFFPERKAKRKKDEPKHLDEALIILPFCFTDTGLDIVADSITGTDSPLSTTIHIFCDIREKEPVNKFLQPLWAKRLDLEIKIG